MKAGIPVQGHIGLTPQTASALGGFKMQGKDASAAKQIIDDARALEDAGAFSIILEAVPAPLGKLVAQSVRVPVIGIGAGSDVDGQVLVTHDMVGLFDRFVPKFVKQYTKIRPVILDALRDYKQEVLEAKFPAAEHSFKMPDETLQAVEEDGEVGRAQGVGVRGSGFRTQRRDPEPWSPEPSYILFSSSGSDSFRFSSLAPPRSRSPPPRRAAARPRSTAPPPLARTRATTRAAAA